MTINCNLDTFQRRISKNVICSVLVVARRDSMFSAYHMGPVASGRGLCDIDRVSFRITKSRDRKLGGPAENITDYKLLIIIKIEKVS